MIRVGRRVGNLNPKYENYECIPIVMQSHSNYYDLTPFYLLKNMLNQGINLLIIDVDGPHQESIPYYIKNYNVNEDFIEKDSVQVNKENMKILLNDGKHPFGHGYCLAMALLGITLSDLDD